MKFGIRIIWGSFARGLQGLFVLGTVCLFALPFPAVVVPQPASEKDLTEPFPCMHRACGCRSAEQCRKSCCCFSNEEKVAWARANKVSLPVAGHQATNAEASPRVSQFKTTTRSTCCDRPHDTTESLTSDGGPATIPTPERAAPDTESSRDESNQWITLKDVAQCQGNAIFWLTISAFALPHAVVIEDAGSLPPEYPESPPTLLTCVFRTPPSPPPDQGAGGVRLVPVMVRFPGPRSIRCERRAA
jgi:hypothetical protein